MSKISQWNLRAIREHNVLRLNIAPGRAFQLGGEHDRRSPRNNGLLDRLEAENAELRGKVVDLMLNIRALRDGSHIDRIGRNSGRRRRLA
jgi:IstB-like ATP binding protein